MACQRLSGCNCKSRCAVGRVCEIVREKVSSRWHTILDLTRLPYKRAAENHNHINRYMYTADLAEGLIKNNHDDCHQRSCDISPTNSGSNVVRLPRSGAMEHLTPTKELRGKGRTSRDTFDANEL